MNFTPTVISSVLITIFLALSLALGRGNVSTVRSTLPTARLDSTSAIYVGKVPIEQRLVSEIQDAVDKGKQPWRLDPLAVAKSDGERYGFSPPCDGVSHNSADTSCDDFYILSKPPYRGVAVIAVVAHTRINYVIQLVQPIIGPGKIWVIANITRCERLPSCASSSRCS
jgi:hypothetical protein